MNALGRSLAVVGVCSLLAACGGSCSPAPAPNPTLPSESCRDALLKKRAALSKQRDAGVASAQTLTAEELRCYGLDEPSGRFLAQVQADVTQAARRLIEPPKQPGDVSALIADRSIKRQKFLSDEDFRRAYTRGDEDGDLVPDAVDRCPNSPRLTPTDAQGCEYDCAVLAKSRSKLVTAEQCKALHRERESKEAEREVLASLVIPISLACEDAPVPSSSAVLGWANVVLEQGQTSSGTFRNHGFELFVTRSPNVKPACELFYEFDMRFTTPAGRTSGGIMFRSKEDASPGNPDIASFVLRTVNTTASLPPPFPGNFSLSATTALVPLPGGRGVARDQLLKASEMQWRVRTVNGLGTTSGWGPFRRHLPGGDLTP